MSILTRKLDKLLNQLNAKRFQVLQVLSYEIPLHLAKQTTALYQTRVAENQAAAEAEAQGYLLAGRTQEA